MFKKGLVLIVFLFPLLSGFCQDLSPVDAQSKVHFVIRNFGLRTGGDFSGLKGEIRFDPARASTSRFDVTVNASTIDTDNDTRDRHLKKQEYFDVAQYPMIRMHSTKVQSTTKAGTFHFEGIVTIKATSKPVKFYFTAEAKDGGYLFKSEDFKLDRRDFGVGSNSVSLSDDVVVSLSVFAK